MAKDDEIRRYCQHQELGELFFVATRDAIFEGDYMPVRMCKGCGVLFVMTGNREEVAR